MKHSSSRIYIYYIGLLAHSGLPCLLPVFHFAVRNNRLFSPLYNIAQRQTRVTSNPKTLLLLFFFVCHPSSGGSRVSNKCGAHDQTYWLSRDVWVPFALPPGVVVLMTMVECQECQSVCRVINLLIKKMCVCDVITCPDLMHFGAGNEKRKITGLIILFFQNKYRKKQISFLKGPAGNGRRQQEISNLLFFFFFFMIQLSF